MRTLLVLTALAGTSFAEPPCDDTLVDPIATPLRDVAIDAQRTACLRDEVSTHLLAHALVDTPEFHGVIGGDLRIAGRMRLGARFELDAAVRLVDYTFVQNAVNKATQLSLGPATIGGAWGGALGTGAVVALVGSLELPFTRDTAATLHTSGELTGVVTASLRGRLYLQARMGALWMHAASSGGSTEQLAFRAGYDLVYRLRRAVALQLGGEVQAGWRGRVPLAHAGVQLRFRHRWRGAVGLGVADDGPTGAIFVLDLGIVRDL